MRTLCDVCESAAAILFCAADEAALCRACDDKVPIDVFLEIYNGLRSNLNHHAQLPTTYNLTSYDRYICVTSSLVDTYESGLPSQAMSHVATYAKILPVTFFYCGIDGSSLCLQCDMIVHVGGKRTHGRYLMLRQRVEFPGDKPGSGDEPGSQRVISSPREKDNYQQKHRILSDQIRGDNNGDGKMENNLIDLNSRPQRMYGQAQTNQEHMDNLVGNDHGSTSVIPDGYFKREHKK
ncbi:hypothetical protein CASFOL_036210 [Castilleja foliolosa]|uniref:B box-type domain-containing protein n=2 Tax=Lamiales TaxID=4143 RepID=A0ABD3BUX0_9LAMI